MLRLEWIVQCCVCKRIEREQAQTDGIGGWMCADCYSNESAIRK